MPKKAARKEAQHRNFSLALILEDLMEESPALAEAWNKAEQAGWRIVATSQRRGYCSYNDKLITIPDWAMEITPPSRDETFRVWYISHEVAHIVAGPQAIHGPIFMEALKLVCPPRAIHHELSYKPKNARAAGISFADVEI